MDESLRIEVVTDMASLQALEGEWHNLLVRSPDATPFVSPAFVLTWYRHYERPNGIYAIVVRRGTELAGLAPFAQTTIGRQRAGLRLLVSAGTEHGHYGEPVLGPDPAPVAAAIAEHLVILARRPGTAVNLRGLYQHGELLRSLRERDDVTLHAMGRPDHAAVVRFDEMDDPERELARLAQKHGVPRRMRRLREAYADVTFTLTDPDLCGALDAMRDLVQRRWATSPGPKLFASRGREAFTRAVQHRLTETGLGSIATLAVDGRRIAVSRELRLGDRCYSVDAAFDPDLKRFGIGQAQIYELLRHTLATGGTEVDFMGGDFAYKRRWANVERVSRSHLLVARGQVGNVDRLARRVAMSLRFRRMARWDQRGAPAEAPAS